jgi:Nucleotidyl transferase of unknown function (DUF2204)
MSEQQRAEVLNLLDVFNTIGLRFLVVGGYAVNHYGYSRTTADIDIYLQDTVENRRRIIEALDKLEYGRFEELLRVPILAGYCEIMMDDGMYVDLMTVIPGLDPNDFDEQYKRRTETEVDGVMITFISYPDLLINKEKTGRPKDRDDYDQLSKVRSGL